MSSFSNIILTNSSTRELLDKFETKLEKMNLSERILEAHKFNNIKDELGIAHLLLIYLIGPNEIQKEIKRIIAWKHVKDKAVFLVEQLENTDTNTVLSSVELLGALGDKYCLTYLYNIFDLKNDKLTKIVMQTLAKLDDPSSLKYFYMALTSQSREIIIDAIDILTHKVSHVPWHIFKPLLYHTDSEIVSMASFAIALRKKPKSAPLLLDIIETTDNKALRRNIIRYFGIIPTKKSILPLLRIITKDNDQKARLEGSRALDRLQGAIGNKPFFKLRNISDQAMRAQIIYRIGKFGSDNKQHKKYLRGLLAKEKEPIVIQACLESFGYIADRTDFERLNAFLTNESPVLSYTALSSLTKTWRLQDRESAIKVFEMPLKPIILQVILRFFIRRAGMGINPLKLLTIVRRKLRDEEAINVRYMSFTLLKFAPCKECLKFLFDSLRETNYGLEKEAILVSITNIVENHTELVFEFLQELSNEDYSEFFNLIPCDLDDEFFKKLSMNLFEKFKDIIGSKEFNKYEHSLFNLFLTRPSITNNFLIFLPNTEWQKIFLRYMPGHSTKVIIEESISILSTFILKDDPEIQHSVVELLMAVKDPHLIPSLVKVSEESESANVKEMAKNIVRFYSEEGII